MLPRPSRPLAGFTVGITGHRRWQEQSELLTRRGARVVHGPTMATSLLGDLTVTSAATELVLRADVDVTIITTGIGIRSWFAAAESLGVDEPLRRALNRSVVVARGPKAQHAAHAAGLDVAWTAPGETNDEVLQRLAGDGLSGRRVVVQRDGGEPVVAEAVRGLGAADVVDVPVYEWHLPDDRHAARRLLDSACRGQLDAVTFTCSYAVHNAFALSDDPDALGAAFRREVLAVAVGPVTAQALDRHGVSDVVQPTRARLGSMVHALVGALAGRACTLALGPALLHWQGATLVDAAGAETDLTAGEVRLLRALVEQAPTVVAKEHLAVPGLDGHAVEAAVARLRTKLGPLGAGIRTVRRRGYACTLERRVA